MMTAAFRLKRMRERRHSVLLEALDGRTRWRAQFWKQAPVEPGEAGEGWAEHSECGRAVVLAALRATGVGA